MCSCYNIVSICPIIIIVINLVTYRRQVGSARAGRDSDTPTRREVMESLPTFWPVCTIVITITQVVMFVAVCIALGLAPIAISTTTERSGCLYGFANPTCSREQREVSPNFFIGPSSESLIHVGAQFTPVSYNIV